MASNNAGAPRRLPFACLPGILLPGDSDVKRALERLRSLLDKAPFGGTLRVSIVDDSGWTHHAIDVGGGTGTPSKSAMDLQIMVSPEIWRDIASGSLSPLQAFVSGKLRARGAHSLGLAIVRHLATTPARLTVCGD